MARICDVEGCERKHSARGLCPMHWKREHGTRTMYPQICDVCGAAYSSARPTGRFCSDACKGAAYQVENRMSRELVHVGPADPVTWLPPQRPVMRKASKPKPHTWYAGSCAWCGDSFTDWQPASRYCSPKCAARASEHRSRRRKGRLRLDVTLAVRLTLYQRDSWVCQLCLEPVDQGLMALSPNDDWAPSLDHIMPRAHGGSDEVHNLRLAHRWCNSVRSDETYYNESALRIAPAA